MRQHEKGLAVLPYKPGREWFDRREVDFRCVSGGADACEMRTAAVRECLDSALGEDVSSALAVIPYNGFAAIVPATVGVGDCWGCGWLGGFGGAGGESGPSHE